jgi:hypothetical protein
LTATVNETGESASASVIAASTTLSFAPPVTVDPGASVTFSFTATAAGGAAMNTLPPAYASMLTDGASPPGPLSGGMLMLGVLLMPLGIKQRRRAVLVAFLGLALIASAAGCGSSSTAATSGQTVLVDSQGNPTKPVALSTIKTSSGNSTQQLTAIEFE